MKIYLAGPMRGYPNFNFEAFDRAAKRGRSLGHEIISPAEMDRAIGFNEKGKDGKVNERGHSELITLDFMRKAAERDFKVIVLDKCDAVAVLPGWERSRGAKAEAAIAEWIGLPLLDARTFEPLPNGFVRPMGVLEAEGREDDTDKMNSPAVIPNGEFVVKDSGARQSFSTGAVRDSGADKGFFHCLPYEPMLALARLYEAGAKKYGKDNWKKGIPLSRYLDSAYRHLFKLSAGKRDEDHAAAVLWNVCGFIWTAEQIKFGNLPPELDDLNWVVTRAA
jgi:hypothetical protein